MFLYLMLAAGFVLLLIGGDMLVRGAVATAERLGMSSLLIGVVVVGFGTSMPEMVTSVEASLAGSPGIAIGNIVGSNLANILLVLGLSAVAAPIIIPRLAARRDGLILLAATFLWIAIGFFSSLDRSTGIGLLLALTLYIWFAYQQERHSTSLMESELVAGSNGLDPKNLSSEVAALAVRRQFAIPLALTLGGLVVLIVGGKLLIDGARGLALEAGVSETIIGLTVVAIGTSLPEIVTCIIAAVRRHGDVALGNVLGSSVYNLLAIGGVTAIISPTAVPAEIVRFDNLVMLAATLTLLVFLFAGTRIGRLQGSILVASYAGYLVWIWPT